MMNPLLLKTKCMQYEPTNSLFLGDLFPFENGVFAVLL